MRHRHPPQRGAGGRETDPGLPRQQPQPHEALHDRAADAGQQPRVAPQPGRDRRAARRVQQARQQIPQQRDQRRPGRQPQPVDGQEKAAEDRQQRQRGQEAPAQAVKEPPAVDRPQRPPPFAQPWRVLPVAAHPAVQALVVAQRARGEAVGKHRVAQIAAAQEGALQRVVGQHAPGREAPLGALQQRVHVQNALPGKAAAVKGVHIQLSAEAAVGVAAPRPGKDQREIGGVGALQLGAQARVDEPVARGDDAPDRVDDRAVERMEHRPDQRERRAREHPGVAVEREDIARAAERVAVPGHREGRGPVGKEPCQLQQRPALALLAAVALAVKAARAGEEIKAAAVFPVERRDGLARVAQQPGVRLRLGGIRGGEIGQDAVLELCPGPALRHAKFLQPLAERPGALRVRQQRREDAEGLALVRHALRQIEPRQPPRREEAQQHQIDRALHQLRHRQQQKRKDPAAAGGEGQQQRQKEAREDERCDVEPLAAVAASVKEKKADVPPLPPRPPGKLPGEHMLLGALHPCQRLDALKVGLAALAVHAPVDPSGVRAQRRVAEVGAAQQLLHVLAAEKAQRGKQRLKGLALRLGIGGVGERLAHGGERREDRGAHRGREEQQLPPPQRRHGLKALQKSAAAPGGEPSLPGGQKRAAGREHQKPLRVGPLPPRPAQIAQRRDGLPLRQIPVVQQPPAGRRRVLRRGVAALDRLVAAAHFGKLSPQRERGGLRLPLAERPGEPGAVGGKIGEPVLRHIQSEKVLIHDAPQIFTQVYLSSFPGRLENMPPALDKRAGLW